MWFYCVSLVAVSYCVSTFLFSVVAEEFLNEEDEIDYELEGEVPTLKRRQLANSRALKLSLDSGCYSENLGVSEVSACNHFRLLSRIPWCQWDVCKL